MILALALCLTVAVPVLAQPSDPPAGAEGGDPTLEREGSERGRREHRRSVRHDGERPDTPEPIRIHLELGRYYLLDEQYAAARDHFLAVAQAEPSADAPSAFEAEEGGEDRGRRERDRALRGRTNAYAMAAVSSELLGDHAGAIALAGEGQALRPSLEEGEEGERRRPRRDPLGDFLADPAAFAAEYAGGAAALEARLLEIESSLDDNVAQ